MAEVRDGVQRPKVIKQVELEYYDRADTASTGGAPGGGIKK